ncbi:MAG: hypothetical protein JNK57_13775 [Planctomycetaceae bacterium]|nr:hypothetical protein [Planctomycetaceae bacterium]
MTTICFSGKLRLKSFVLLAMVGVMVVVLKPVVVEGQDASTEPTAEVFSGPQPGEPLPEFVFRELLVEKSGRELNLVQEAAGSPLLLVFVHQVNRPSIGFTRVLSKYAHSRQADGLRTGVVFLDSDATAAEANLRRIQHALTPGVLTGVSIDGQEGPGSYGLNRKVELTILMAKDNVVTSNFALIQPSIQVDLPKVLQGIVAVVGGTVPELSELEGLPPMREQATNGNQPPNLRPLLQPMLNKNATDEQIDASALVVEEAAEKDEALRKELGRACKTIVDAGKVGNYGSPKTQEYFKKWAEQFGKPSPDQKGPDR